MTLTIWTDRSRIETAQRCQRLRWLEYHEAGTGIVPARKPLALCVGGSVHRGLETLLSAYINNPQDMGPLPGTGATPLEDDAVAAALSDFATHRSALALDLTESAAINAVVDVKDQGFPAQLIAMAQELGMDANDPALAELLQRQRNSAAEFDDWLWREQAALVEGLVRAYARRRLRPLLEEFEVLEVEREGDWLLTSLVDDESMILADEPCPDCGSMQHRSCDGGSIRFMSRPDALLRSRSDNSLYLLSYKTAATWDVRKARDAEHDMQGLSEGVEIERRLAQWWQEVHYAYTGRDAAATEVQNFCDANVSIAMRNFLASIPAPPRILGIRYEYLLKGFRMKDDRLSKRFGLNVWSQRSHLIRRYVAHSTPSRGKNAGGFDIGDSAWSWDYQLEDGSTSKLSASNWHSESILDDGGPTVREWIDLLDDSQLAMSAFDSTVGQEPRPLGWKSAAQALGYTATHPLDDVFPAPLTVYRSDDQLRDWIEQVEAQETRVAEAVASVSAAADDGEKRHLLNVSFPMSRRACSYPSECAMTKVCYGGDDIRSRPLESGLYRIRVANHAQERDAAVVRP